MATAYLKAIMGMETDGAERAIGKFSMSLRTLKTAIGAAFAVAALRKFVQTAEDLRKFQQETGLKLVSDDDLRNINRAAGKIEELGMRLKALAVGFGSKLIAGIEAAAAYVGARSAGSTSQEAWNIAGNQMGEDSLRQKREAQKKLEDDAKKSAEEEKRTAERVSKLKDDIAAKEREMNLKALTDLERMATLAAEIAKLRADAKGATTEEARLKIMEQIVDRQAEIADIQRERAATFKKEQEDIAQKRQADAVAAMEEGIKAAEEAMAREKRLADIKARGAEGAANATKISAPPLNADSAIRVGAVIGALENPAVRSAQRALAVAAAQLEVQKRMEAELQALNAEVQDG